MTGSTPYDADRAAYSREALARLVVCDSAVQVADSAAGLVGTEHDGDTGAGGRASQAAQVVDLARELLSAAVIYERERGSSWAAIGRYLRLTAEQAEATYGGDVLRWRAAFDEPYRLDETGRKRIPNLPPAAYDPVRAGGVLDRWAKRHLPLVNHPHPVTGSLDCGEMRHSAESA